MNSRECHLKVVFWTQKSKKRKGNGYAFRVRCPSPCVMLVILSIDGGGYATSKHTSQGVANALRVPRAILSPKPSPCGLLSRIGDKRRVTFARRPNREGRLAVVDQLEVAH